MMSPDNTQLTQESTGIDNHPTASRRLRRKGLKPTFSCDSCNNVYQKANMLLKHRRLKHPKLDILACQECNFVCPPGEKNRLIDHIRFGHYQTEHDAKKYANIMETEQKKALSKDLKNKGRVGVTSLKKRTTKATKRGKDDRSGVDNEALTKDEGKRGRFLGAVSFFWRMISFQT